MAQDPRISQLHERLHHMEKELASTRERLGKAGNLQPHHHAQADEIKTRAGAMRTKLDTAGQGDWSVMKHEVEADWSALMGSFDRWVSHVDADYGNGKN